MRTPEGKVAYLYERKFANLNPADQDFLTDMYLRFYDSKRDLSPDQKRKIENIYDRREKS